MRCPNCGVENAEEARTCAMCGASLSAAPKPAAEPIEPAAEPVEQPAAEPIEQPAAEPIEQLAAEPDEAQSPAEQSYVPAPVPKKKRSGAALLAVGVLLLAMVAVVVAILVRQAVPGDGTPEPDLTARPNKKQRFLF